MRRRSPNIVLILADDLGFGDLGCYNPDCRIPTPNIDALAGRGVRWTDMHAASAVCTPSRYAMLTGRLCWRDRLPYGVLYGYEPPLINVDQPTVASILSGAGYRTACVGKWHLGLEFTTKEPGTVDFTRPLPWKGVDTELESLIDLTAPLGGGPITRGFDTFFGTAGCSTAQPPYAFIDQDRFVETPSEFRERIHFTGRPGMHSPSWDHARVDPTFADEAVRFVHSNAASDGPFFLYLAASAPHEPCLEATVPEFARGMSGAGSRGDLVWLFDWMVGRVVDALSETGLADDTLVVVTSDNGALPGDRVNESDDLAGYELYGHRSCGDWRGYKAHIWEGGHRVPFVVAPAAVTGAAGATRAAAGAGAANRARRVVDEPACLIDLYATFASLAGVSPDAGSGEDSLDLSGHDGFAEWLCNGNGVGPSAPGTRTALVHHSVFGVYSARLGDWKLVSECSGSGGWPPPRGTFPTPGAPGQLYELREDPAESQNLWTDRPGIVAELEDYLASIRAGGATVIR